MQRSVCSPGQHHLHPGTESRRAYMTSPHYHASTQNVCLPAGGRALHFHIPQEPQVAPAELALVLVTVTLQRTVFVFCRQKQATRDGLLLGARFPSCKLAVHSEYFHQVYLREYVSCTETPASFSSSQSTVSPGQGPAKCSFTPKRLGFWPTRHKCKNVGRRRGGSHTGRTARASRPSSPKINTTPQRCR